MFTQSTELTNDLYDVLVRNGAIIDGTGRAAYIADIAIQGDRIVKVEPALHARGRAEMDVRGLVVAPGFIDVHAHDDAAVIARPQMLSKLTQGVTTVVCGNCGISGAPYDRRGTPSGLMYSIFKFEDHIAAKFEAYARKVREAGPATNALFLTGHTTLRMQVMGDALHRPATTEEIAEMRDLLMESLEQGSFGLSTGLAYPEARAASIQELTALGKSLASYGGIYTTHMRDEGDGIIESLEETLHIGRAIGTRVIISHHKCLGRTNFGRSVETLALLRAAQKRQPVSWDVYPYTASSTVLSEERVAQAAKVLISWSDTHPEFSACDLRDVARRLGCSEAEAVRRLQPAGAIYFLMDEQDVQRILRSGAMIGSDGLPEDRHPHPRLWGAFPRVLGHYVRDQRLMTLEEAIHRMTGFSSKQFNLDHRGQIAVGWYADLCIFDPELIADSATFERPAQAAQGVHHVMVNGQFGLKDGVPTAVRSGVVLQRSFKYPPRDIGAAE